MIQTLEWLKKYKYLNLQIKYKSISHAVQKHDIIQLGQMMAAQETKIERKNTKNLPNIEHLGLKNQG